MTLSLSDPSLLKNQAYINGEWVDADNGATFPVTNPADGSLITEVAKMGAAETARPAPRPHGPLQALSIGKHSRFLWPWNTGATPIAESKFGRTDQSQQVSQSQSAR